MTLPAKLKSVHPAIYWSIFSGMAALIYQVVLQKVFSYVLGYALLSTTIVVAAYMLGLALGGFLVGLFCDKLTPRACLSFYILIEVGIGLCGLGSLIGYSFYISNLPGLIANPAFVHLMSLVAVRAVVAMSALLPMTILMGATLPVLTLGVRASTGQGESDASEGTVAITSLYSANLLGGMAGIVVSAYFVVPYFGLWGATIFACCANLTIAVLILRFRSSARFRNGESNHPRHPQAPRRKQSFRLEDISWSMVCFLSFASGLIIFALEIIWMHLLAAVVGNSVYAFANMLFAVFVGLYLAANREEKPAAISRTSLAWLVLWGSVILVFSVPFYAWSPLLFSAIGLFSPGFLIRQVVLVAVACFLIVPVAMLLSRIFPRLLAVGVPSQHKGRGVGFLLAINTFGCLLGLFLGNFVLIPVFGSQNALKGLAATLGVIAYLVYRQSRKAGAALVRPLSRFVLVISGLAIVALMVPWWPPHLLLSDRSTYFGLFAPEFKPLYYMGEDAESGFVTVSGSSDGTVTLLTNGKFQGDNRNQMPAQFSFGYLPALAVSRTDRAFMIGCGTGVSVRALAEAGFKQISLAEISKPILFAARTYFRKENGGILDDPRVTVIHDDGRNALALSQGQYDVISVELTSIWFAGAANLYSSDFYSIVHRKLAPGGVFQQWVQLHHMRIEDLYVLLNTVQSRFKYVALWSGGEQGQILASDEPLSLDWERMRLLAATPAATQYISVQEIYHIPYEMILDDSGVRQFVSLDTLRMILKHPLGQKSLPSPSQLYLKVYLSQFVDTDVFPYLEYATPRGNVTSNQELLIPAFLARWTDKPVVVPFRNLPGADLPLAQALLSYRNGACHDVDLLLRSGAVNLRPHESALFNGCTSNYAMDVLNLH
jgi:spermidine synthase